MSKANIGNTATARPLEMKAGVPGMNAPGNSPANNAPEQSANTATKSGVVGRTVLQVAPATEEFTGATRSGPFGVTKLRGVIFDKPGMGVQSGGVARVPSFLQAETAIQNLWVALGGAAGFLGEPNNPNSAADALPDGIGFFRAFQGGLIYWCPQTGAHEVHGAILAKWASLGWERGFLGYPITDETGTPDGVGRFNHFQGGSIYWTPQTGAFEVHGAIRDKWASLGWERGFLGYPITDETGTPDGVGRFNHFQGGSVYWTAQTGAFEVHGAIRDKWASLGWETSYLGYPISDEHDCGANRCSDFQHGTISWNSNTGAMDIPQTVAVDAPNITFGSGIAIGGNGNLTLASNGVVRFRGHMHDSGFPSYDYLAVFTVKDSSGRAYSATHTGRAHGTDESGSRDSDWDESTTNDLVRQNWQLIQNGTGGWKVDVTSDWSPQKIAEDIASLVGTVVGIVALFV